MGRPHRNINQIAIERAALLADDETLRGRDLLIPTSRAGDTDGSGQTQADVEREAIRRATSEVGGNRRLAAERLDMRVRTLYEKLKRCGLE